MRRGWIVPLGLLAVVVLAVGGWIVSNYNNLVNKQLEVKREMAQVDNLLLRRNDLIPNLVQTVSGIAAQERAVFGAVADARARMAGARTSQERIAAAPALDSAIGRLLVVLENYPQLRSQENFLRLQDELAGTENRLAVQRGRYNEVVTEYNGMVRRFPANLIAGMLGFGQEQLYQVAPEARERPDVRFNIPEPGADTAGARR